MLSHTYSTCAYYISTYCKCSKTETPQICQSETLYREIKSRKQHLAVSTAALQLQPNHWHDQHHTSLLFWNTCCCFPRNLPLSFPLPRIHTHGGESYPLPVPQLWPPLLWPALKQETLMWWAGLALASPAHMEGGTGLRNDVSPIDTHMTFPFLLWAKHIQVKTLRAP